MRIILEPGDEVRCEKTKEIMEQTSWEINFSRFATTSAIYTLDLELIAKRPARWMDELGRAKL